MSLALADSMKTTSRTTKPAARAINGQASLTVAPPWLPKRASGLSYSQGMVMDATALGILQLIEIDVAYY